MTCTPSGITICTSWYNYLYSWYLCSAWYDFMRSLFGLKSTPQLSLQQVTQIGSTGVFSLEPTPWDKLVVDNGP